MCLVLVVFDINGNICLFFWFFFLLNVNINFCNFEVFFICVVLVLFGFVIIKIYILEKKIDKKIIMYNLYFCM